MRELRETDLLSPVLKLFPKRAYRRYTEVKLGRKRVDLLCSPRLAGDDSICVELKLEDWKRALWQASRNFHLAPRSYVAVWHSTVDRAMNHESLFLHYGVGLISVGPRSATIVRESRDPVARLSRLEKRELYEYLLEV